MDDWLSAALDYVPRWIEFQLRHFEQPGCVVAIAHKDIVLLDEAFGSADLATAEPLTPRHRFRVASHSKSFTAAGILKLREQGRLRLDDPVGSFVENLHPDAAQATLSQLLSHSAGLVRDGIDSGQFMDRRPYLSADEIRRDLQNAPPLATGERFKYSNHGYGLLGLVIEAVTGLPYASWIKREIVDAAGLHETTPDIGGAGDAPLARGHSGRLPLDRRVIIPGDNPTNAVAAAAGFVSTARDLARFFAQLSPRAERSILTAASRREMVRRHWRDQESSLERHYGLGIISGSPGEWSWFGHSGSFQGFITRTAVIPEEDLTISVLTNAIDGLAHPWFDGIHHILKAFRGGGAPASNLTDWTGRWWTLWGAIDLVPIGGKVVGAIPASFTPFTDASEIEVTGRDAGRIVRASGFNSVGEPARLVRDGNGVVHELWAGGAKLLPESSLRDEMSARYAG
jgi:D-alanyl-D-alanine carboxypeptidase